MDHQETDTKGALIETAPLFASVWLALFNELRKNYIERRDELADNSENSNPINN